MKNLMKLIGLIAIIAIIGFSLAACGGDGDDGNPEDQTLQTQNVMIAGTFSSLVGTADVKFYADTASVNPSLPKSRNVTTSDDFALEGLLEDSGKKYRLKGFYNSISNTYVLSASSDDMRFDISGEFTAGKAKTGNAVIQEKENGDWKRIDVSVAVAGTPPTISDVGIIADNSANGIPANLRGVWRASNNLLYAIITSHSIIWTAHYDNKWNIQSIINYSEIATASGITSGIRMWQEWNYDALYTLNYEWKWIMFEDYCEENDFDFNRFKNENAYNAMVNEHFNAAGGEDLWLFNNYPEKIVRQYGKETIRLKGDKLQTGQYYLPNGIVWENGAVEDKYVVENYSELNTLTTLTWDEINLWSR